MKRNHAKTPEKQTNAARQTIAPARVAAYEILRKIAKEKAFSAVLLPLYEEKLTAKDRALTHELTLGVLRRQIFLDRIIQSLVKQKLEKFDLEVLIALRLGLYQLLFLDKIPAFSAINESVNLVKLAKKTSAANLVNAVLRRAAREKVFAFDYTDEIEKISVETSHPRLLVERWREQFGTAETRKLCEKNNETPALAFRLTAKANAKTAEILQKLGVELCASEIVAGAWRVERTSEMLFTYHAEGRIYFQEESSQLVAASVNLADDENFLDVCAAPGSKFTQIAARENFAVAGDLHLPRLQFLRESARRQGLNKINAAIYDAEKSLPFADESFDAILLDAPCSGTGTIRHNPEIRYFLCDEDFAELSGKQLRILASASKLLKKSGRLIYSTCSLEREENEAVVESFLAANLGFEKVSPAVAERFLTAEKFARIFPPRDDADGFFVAMLRRKY